ncbi:MAG: phosphoenolpyruvate carboxykinase (GTP) [Oligoflexales bacterium]
MNTTRKDLQQWVAQVAALTKPERIQWCDGSEEEYQSLIDLMLKDGQLTKLNQDTYPGCYLHRSDPNDVARTEHLTFVCTEDKNDVGSNNNWMSPPQGHERADKLFDGAMQGRTMYVLPYCMGPLDSPHARCGVEITDSAYVAVNMKIMTRMGAQALKRIEEKKEDFVKGLHSTGDLNIENRLILHFPEELAIKSIGSGYGGNALLGKKCHALRIGSYQARQEGWLAEHMLIVGIENPKGEVHYVAAAFPSACGKTNLAMLIPPESHKGWKIWTVGDDIAWIHPHTDGRLYAINPEAGFFGVVPGTSSKTNPNAMSMIQKDTIFTNVAVTENNEPWWEGKDNETPVTDWQGRSYEASRGPAAHPNARFTVSAKNCPSYSQEAEAPAGVPLSAIIFGGRRKDSVPLVQEALSWEHGVLLGASVASETTAAATGAVGVVRHDPMAMKPFCGYSFGAYWNHWLSFSKESANLPKIFHVNWFRQDQDGKFMWPGFGENIRVLRWILERTAGKGEAVHTPIGNVPAPESLDIKGLDLSGDTLKSLLTVDKKAWAKEMSEMGDYLKGFGEDVPANLLSAHKTIVNELS